MKMLKVDLNLLTEDELEMYLILSKATQRIELQKEKIVLERQKLEQNIKEANKGWMEQEKSNEIPAPPKFTGLGKFPEQ